MDTAGPARSDNAKIAVSNVGLLFSFCFTKREFGDNNFPENVAVVYFSGTLESPDCFQIEGVPLSVYNWSFMEVRQFK